MNRDSVPPVAPAGLLSDLGAARERTLAVLERVQTLPSGAGRLSDALVALQEAANRLGAAERDLSGALAARREEPAPIVAAGEEPADNFGWTGEASAVLGLVEFTVPYAAGPPQEADRWLRALRREDAVGRVLGDLGFADGELADAASPPSAGRNEEPLRTVSRKASLLARHRGAPSVTTTDLLFAVLSTYGGLVDRALYARGIGPDQLVGSLAAGAQAALPG